DAIFINRWEGSGMCYCEHCHANFKAATGHELPRGATTLQDPVRRAYFFWRQQRLFALWRQWDAAVRAINPDSCVVPNTAGGPSGSLDMARIGELAPTIAADRQARHGPAPLWFAGRSAKEYRAVMADKPVIGLSGVGLEEPYRWKDSVQAPAELKLWMIDALANGARPWFVKFAGHLEDPRWLEPVAEFYDWCHRAERYLRNTRSLARVGVVYSQQSLWFGANHARVDDAGLGWYQALVEARVPFELVHDRRLDAADLAPFRTLILPNLVALSDAQCAQLRAFAARGGSLVATAATSLADESGAPRRDFGLADLFGVRFTRTLEGPIQNAYIRLEHDRAPDHPLLRGLADAPRTIAGTWRVEVEATAKFPAPPLTLIPSYPDLPMEKVYARQPQTDIAQVFLRELPGGGRVAYLPWDLDRTFWETLDVDHGMLLQNTVAWATNEPAPVLVRGPGVLDVTCWQQKDSVTVHLVNLTNPMLMHGPIRDYFPVGEQQLSIRLPAGVHAKSVRLLVTGAAPAFQQAGDIVELAVPSITAHEVVAIDV
ncbi:MAG TPA: beta-galactosidase trimerization domain-containing protein, partial [Opitutus sp.]|nr:beta-galactosidase trimerization domain-containing protein [Opitutus sp.]